MEGRGIHVDIQLLPLCIPSLWPLSMNILLTCGTYSYFSKADKSKPSPVTRTSSKFRLSGWCAVPSFSSGCGLTCHFIPHYQGRKKTRWTTIKTPTQRREECVHSEINTCEAGVMKTPLLAMGAVSCLDDASLPGKNYFVQVSPNALGTDFWVEIPCLSCSAFQSSHWGVCILWRTYSALLVPVIMQLFSAPNTPFYLLLCDTDAGTMQATVLLCQLAPY